MARQIAEIKITGTIEHLCFYKMYGQYYVRLKSSLTTKQFWKDRAFEGSRRSCTLLSRASRLASRFYKDYPKENKVKGLFNEMTGRVKLWLREGKEEKEVLLLLKENYPVREKEIKRKTRSIKKKAVRVKDKPGLFRVLIDPNLSLYPKRSKRAGSFECSGIFLRVIHNKGTPKLSHLKCRETS